MPKIGLRNIKTAISILICLLLYVLLSLINSEFANGWYTPFYAGIATAYSVYPSKKKSLQQAKTRVIASIIGGVLGMLLIWVYEVPFGMDWPEFGHSGRVDYIIPYTLVAVFSILVVYVTVLTKQTTATFVAILTLLSITTNARYGLNFMQFGINRILSTIIGVLVALLVNNFYIPHFKNKDMLMVVGLDGLFSDDQGKINGFINYKMTKLISDGAKMSIFTTRTPAILLSMLENVNITEPVFVFNGAGLYDLKERKYLYVENIGLDTSIQLIEFFKENELTPFINFVSDDVLYTYCEKIDNTAEEVYAKNRKNSAYSCFVNDKAPKREITYIIAIQRVEVIDRLIQKIYASSFINDICLYNYDYYEVSGEIKGFKYLKIYSSKILELNALKHYDEKYSHLVAVGNSEYDLPLFNKADIAISNRYAPTAVVNKSTYVEESKSAENMFKRLSKVYTNRQYKNS